MKEIDMVIITMRIAPRTISTLAAKKISGLDNNFLTKKKEKKLPLEQAKIA